MNIFSSKGQSLFECILVVPLFFVLLSGIIVLYQQQMRSYQDEGTQSALSVSEGHFELEERKAAGWLNKTDRKQSILDDVAYNALNPSYFFKKSKDLKEKVFLEKTPILKTPSLFSSDICSVNSIYEVITKNKGEFDFKTCAQTNAYERGSLPLSLFLEPIAQELSGFSLFHPHPDFAWPNRDFEIIRSVHAFALTPRGLQFSRDIASLSASYRGEFNIKCYLEPFDPQCNLHSISNKLSRVAKDSANLQISACFIEGAMKCTGTAAAIPVCLAANTAALKTSLEFGIPSPLCPILNATLKSEQWSVQKTVFAHSLIIRGREIVLRGHFLIGN